MPQDQKYKLNLKEYKTLFDGVYPSMCLFAVKYVNDSDVAKDIVQEVFIKIWEKKVEFQNENAVKSYLYTSIKNKSLDYLKSKYVKNTETFSLVDVKLMEDDSFFMNEVVVAEVSNTVQQAIASLPPKCAEILKLSIQNYKNEEIAALLNISVNTVKAQKKIAYKKLKPMLESCLGLITYIFYSSQ